MLAKREKNKSIILKGIMHIASASVINKIVAFGSNILVVRTVNQYEYGLFSSANNVISMAILFTGLGTISGVLQYGSEERTRQEKEKYFKYCALVGISFDFLITFFVCVYAKSEALPIEHTRKYIFMLLPSIILHYIFEYFGAILRSEKKVKEYARLLNVNSISFSILSCVGALCWGVSGMTMGRNLSYILGIAMGVYYNKDVFIDIISAPKLEKSEKSELIEYSISCCITSALNRILYILDIMIISYIVKNPNDIAIYKVGTIIPEALEFIPQSILITIIPYFITHNKDLLWLRKWTKKLYIITAGVNFFITMCLFLGAPFVIRLCWGEQYVESVTIFRCLSINYFIMSTFRQNGTNILSILRKTRYNVLVSIITCGINIVLNVLFVTKWGITGAAYATIIVVIVASTFSFTYIVHLLYSKKER